MKESSLIPKQVLETLAYFDLFAYPLTYHELYAFLPSRPSPAAFHAALEELLEQGALFAMDTFYALQQDPALVSRRKKGNQQAEQLMKKARWVAQFLIRFPYVRGVAISGSLSKNFADEHSDIDLFIITEQNRLWIARTFMHLFKKLSFLVGRQHDYCMNYYLDEQHLEIKEKNLYTAIEVATLIPLEGKASFQQFFRANAWAKTFLPNQFICPLPAKELPHIRIKNKLEKLFNLSFGSRLENWFMRLTAKRWNQKTQQKKLNMKGLVMSMEAHKHYAKPDPKHFQSTLLERYRLRLAELGKQPQLGTIVPTPFS